MEVIGLRWSYNLGYMLDLRFAPIIHLSKEPINRTLRPVGN